MRRLFVPIVALVAAAAATVALSPAASAAPETSQATPAAAGGFTDVPTSSGFYGDIAWLVDNNITKGYNDGGFHPTDAVSRQSMAAFLYREQNPGKTATACTTKHFKDVPITSPFCADINWLVGTNITNGYADGGFHPTAPVSRQSMAAFLYRLANDGAKDPGCSSKPFPDVAAGSQFCGAIAWLADQDITGGYADGGFHPGDAVSRQSMAAFLHRFAAPAPPVSVSRYIRTSDPQKLQQAGTDDAASDAANKMSARLHLLQTGAQTNSDAQIAAVGAPGVLLSSTSIRLTYAQLVTLLSSYIQSYVDAAGGASVTIAIGTNSDGDFSAYTANQKGQDWWNEVVAPLRADAPANVTIVGANDIEPGFAATPAQADNWKSAFLTTSGDAKLIINGSADGCPTTFGNTTGACNNGWTPAQLKALYSGAQVSALPQIYSQKLAVQWANIAMAAGSATPDFVGTLTQDTACGADGCSWSPQRGWIALWNELTAAGVTPHLDYASDLEISS